MNLRDIIAALLTTKDNATGLTKGGISTAFSLLSSSTKAFLGIGTAITAITAAYKGFKLLDDKFTLTFATAQKHMEESASAYESNYSELQSINSELETTSSRVTELKSQGTLTIAEEDELAKLERQNSLLEAQQKLKQSATDASQKQTASDAATSINFKSEKSIQTRTDKNGVDMEVAIDRKEYIREQVSLMEDAQRQIDQATEKINSGDKSKKWEEQLKTASDNLNTYRENATNTLSELNLEAENLYDKSTGQVIKGYEGLVNEISSLNNLVNNFDLTEFEKISASIESFFDGSTKSNTIKEKLLEAVKSGESATDALHAMGITLNDLGITGEGKKAVFDDYFSGLIESAKEAEEAINSIDGSVEGVKTALDSENQNADWSSMAEAANTVAELYKNGQVGTDDFKAFTQFMSKDIINPDANGIKYDADAYVEAYKAATDKIKRYFDSENPLQSVANFSNDLVNNGLATQVGDDLTWSFKSSAEAADKLGLSVDAVEVLMHNLEAYGAEFDKVMWSSEGLEEYKSALDGISDMYDTITDKESKDRLKGILDQAQIDDFENNLEKLSPEIIANLKFEYNLAEIQQQIENLQNDIKTSGGSTEQWGALVSAQIKKRDKLSSQDDMSSAVNDSGYQASVEQVDKLSNKLLTEYDSLGKSGRRAIEQQQSALVELQNSYLEMFQSGDVVNWEEFLNSNQLSNVLNDISTRTGIEIADLQQLFGVDLGTIPLDAEINIKKDDIESKLKEYSEGGNVDLTVRPVIDSSELANAGWDVAAGEAATVFTSTFSNEAGNIAMNFTPIMTDENGNFTGVMSPEQLQKYAEEVIAGVREDDLNLKIGATYEGDDAIAQAEKAAEEIHQLHQDYFDDNTITMRVDASTEEIQARLNQLQSGQTLLFQAEVDGEPKGIEALKRQDGTIAYTVEDDGVQYYLQEVKNEDGTLTYSADIEGVQTQLLPMLNQDGTVTYIKVGQEEASDSEAGVNYNKTSQEQASDSTAGVGYKKTSQEAPSDKTAGVWYKIKGVIGNISNFLTGGGGISGTAHPGGGSKLDKAVHGKAYLNGTLDDNSWIKDDWKTQKDNVALTGEVGQEMVVNPKTNTWRTVGDNGAEFTEIPKGSIVFDAKQTKDLLSKGHINSRGRAFVNGTAYANGFRIPSAVKSYSSTTTKVSTTKNTATNTASKASQAAQSATQAAEDLFDFVETLLNRTKETTEKLTNAIDDAVSLADKMSKNSSTLTQVQKEISVNQQAYQKYLAQANAVGLAEGYASQIRNGSLNIENITDEDLKKKIDDYQKWYDKAKSCQDVIRDLQKDEKDLALSRLEYIEDYYDSIIKLNDAYKDVNDARIEFNDAIGNTAIGKEVQDYLKSSYDKQYDSYNKALTQLSDYQNEFNELVRNGYINEGSEAWYDGQQKIQEFTKQVDESATALIELEDKIREIDYTRLQQIIDGSDRRTDQLKNAQSLAEARDQLVGRDELQKQVDVLSKSINANYALRDKKLQEQNLYDVTSTRYQDLAKEIADLDGEIYSSLEDIEDLKDKIFETEFFNYEKEQENLKYFIGELDDFAKLLNEDAFFDKNGAFTDEAYSKIALVGEAMSKTKQETANATEALRKLDEMYQNGLISETEYTDKQHDLLDTIRDSVSATEDYKNELIDLYKEQMEKSNDALKENISLRKEALKNAKDYEDYADSLKDKTKSVNELDAQINSLQNVNNSQARAELKRLIAQRDEAQKSLDDLKKDHTYDLMQDGYDIMSENLDKSLQDIEYSISHSSEKQLQVVQSMLSQMVSSYSDAFGKISSIISNTGFVGTGSFNNTTNNISSSTGSSSIASGATQDQSTIRPSDSASNINSDNISNGNHGAIESEIKKEPNVDNRLCAELKINTNSITLQEGNQSSITAKIRPNDAKNKTLAYTSANPSIASVSADGKVTGVAPGTTTITVSTTDGSNLVQTCKVTVTKKPDPPKPVTPPSNNKSTIQGNGVPDVGDKVTFVSGIYHEDSYGGGRWGNWNLGQSVYITKINPNSPYPIHISTGNRLGNGDRGWLRLNQLRGYRTGSRRINGSQWAWTQEDNKEEVIFRASDGAMLTPLGKGDTIFNNEQVQRLWEMSKGLDMSKFINLNTSNVIGSLPNIVNRNEMNQKHEINMNFDTLMTIEGNVSKDAIPGLQKEIDKMIPHISDKLGIYLRGELKR